MAILLALLIAAVGLYYPVESDRLRSLNGS